MVITESSTLVFLLIILTIGLLIPELLKRFRLPFITLIILAGSILGPNGFKYVEHDNIITFFGFLGMAFLMLLAGLETNISQLAKEKRHLFLMASMNAFIPFLVGILITKLFGYSIMTSLLIGIIFISSSVAIIVPSLQNNKYIKKESLQLILSAVMITDVISLMALGLIFQNTLRITQLPLPIYFSVLIASIPFLFYIIPKISKYALQKRFSIDEGHERKLRFVMVIIIAVLAFYSVLGVHPILAAFLAGLALSSVVMGDKTKLLYTKLHTLGYGLFVPVFFFIVGMDMDLKILVNFDVKNIIIPSLILGLIFSKIFSGYVSGRLSNLSKKASLLYGTISITQLTTTLAVTFVAASIGIIDSLLTTTIILLSIVTTFLGPTLSYYISRS